jgi:hypothetical protein
MIEGAKRQLAFEKAPSSIWMRDCARCRTTGNISRQRGFYVDYPAHSHQNRSVRKGKRGAHLEDGMRSTDDTAEGL